MTRWIRVPLLILLLVVAAPWTAGAQSTVHLLRPSPVTGELMTLDMDGPTVLATDRIPAPSQIGIDYWPLGGEYATPDGALVVWMEEDRRGSGGPSTLALFDVVRRRTSIIPISRFTKALVGNPRRSEVFITDERGPIALSPAGVRRLQGPSCAGFLSFPLRISADGSRVMYSCAGPATYGNVFVLDTDSGNAVALRRVESTVPALSPDGRSWYFVEAGMLRRYSIDSGALLAEVAVPGPVAGLEEYFEVVRVDPRTGRVLLLGMGMYLYDGTTLQLERSTPAPWAMPGLVSPKTWTFDPDRPRAYVSAVRVDQNGAVAAYWVIDTDLLTVAFQVDDTRGQVVASRFLVAPRPAPPVGLSPSVEGSRVNLLWAVGGVPGVVTRYVLEVGTGPGRRDIVGGLDIGQQTSFSASGVPPGSYYVRVRAGNYTGLSAPSNEVIVTIP